MISNEVHRAGGRFFDAGVLVQVIWLAIIWGIIATPVLRMLAQPDVAHPFLERSGAGLVAQPSGLSLILGNVTNLGIFLASLGGILLGALHRRTLSPGVIIWLGAMALSLGPFLSSFFGLQPALTASTFRLPILLTAIFLLPPVTLTWFIRQCKHAIAAFTYVTLVTMVFVPGWVLDTAYDKGLVSVWTYRLHGVGVQANGFAVLLLTYLILDWLDPPRNVRGQLSRMAIVASLIMTQSKTVWIATAIIYMIYLLYASGITRFLAMYLIALGITSTLLVLSFIVPTWDQALKGAVFTEDATTLTGRTDIWEYTLDVWARNPIFGYGPQLWHPEGNLAFARLYHWGPGQAHNQFFQTLGESGLIGVAGLLCFALVLLVYSVRFARLTSGVSLALFAALMTRSITEAPLIGTLSVELFFFVVTFAVLVLAHVHATAGFHVPSVNSDEPDPRSVHHPSFAAPNYGSAAQTEATS